MKYFNDIKNNHEKNKINHRQNNSIGTDIKKHDIQSDCEQNRIAIM